MTDDALPSLCIMSNDRSISTEHGKASQLCIICFRTSLKVNIHAPFPVISPATPYPNIRMSLC